MQEYVSTLKPHVAPEPLNRFETAPGVQMQVDFTTIKHEGVTLKAFVAILGYSRVAYVQFFDDERLVSWLEGLRASFEFVGGVTESVLFDNVNGNVKMTRRRCGSFLGLVYNVMNPISLRY